jgi:hypothetical protein
MHHITTTEAALAGAAIAAIASVFSGLAVQRAARRTAHTGRIWESQREAYKYVLAFMDRWRELRASQLSAVINDDSTIVPDSPEMEPEGADEARILLQMFGERRVQDAFERTVQASIQMPSAVIGWRSAANLNIKAAAGEVPPHEAVGGPELVRLRHAAEAAEATARARHEELIEVIRSAIGRIPRYERRWKLPRKRAWPIARVRRRQLPSDA